MRQSGRASLRRCPNPHVRLELKGLQESGMKRAKGKGIQAMGTAYKAQHTKNRAAAEEPVCRSAQASQALLPPVSPTCPQPRLASFTRIFAFQTAANELAPRDHSLVLGGQARPEKGCVKRGDWGRGQPKQLTQATCIPQGRAWDILIWPHRATSAYQGGEPAPRTI